MVADMRRIYFKYNPYMTISSFHTVSGRMNTHNKKRRTEA